MPATTREKLNQLRHKCGLSVAAMAAKSGVAQGTLSTFLSGNTATIGFDNLIKILDSVGVSADWFAHVPEITEDTVLPTPDQPAAPAPVAPPEPKVVIAHLPEDMDKAAADAMERVMTSPAYKAMLTNVRWWRGIALCLLAAIVIVWLVLEIKHPAAGMIRFK